MEETFAKEVEKYKFQSQLDFLYCRVYMKFETAA